eukprot:scaffold9001_cov127-Isochrysis_galbana.AAC.3
MFLLGTNPSCSLETKASAEFDDSRVVGAKDVDALWGNEGAPDDGVFAAAFGLAGLIGDLVLTPARVDWVEAERGPAGGNLAELIVLHVDGDVHKNVLVNLAALGVGLGGLAGGNGEVDGGAGDVVGERDVDPVGVHGDVILGKVLFDGVDHGSRGWGADAHRVDRHGEIEGGEEGLDMGGGGESVEVSLLQGFTFKIHFGDVNFGVSSSFGDLGEDEVPMVDLLGVGQSEGDPCGVCWLRVVLRWVCGMRRALVRLSEIR